MMGIARRASATTLAFYRASGCRGCFETPEMDAVVTINGVEHSAAVT